MDFRSSSPSCADLCALDSSDPHVLHRGSQSKSSGFAAADGSAHCCEPWPPQHCARSSPGRAHMDQAHGTPLLVAPSPGMICFDAHKQCKLKQGLKRQSTRAKMSWVLHQRSWETERRAVRTQELHLLILLMLLDLLPTKPCRRLRWQRWPLRVTTVREFMSCCQVAWSPES